MDDDSLNFGSPAAATPNSNPILAQPPLRAEDAISSGQDNHTGQGDGAAGDGIFLLLITSFL
jgi:SWI/SNF related-matrix-associated actin-dependent regulator of chromatin subfamily C